MASRIHARQIRVLQINLNRCKLAQELLAKSATQYNADVICISEPYRILEGWHADTRGDVAIFTPPGSALLTHDEVSTGEGFVLLRASEWLVGSCYCSPNVTQEVFLNFVDGLARGMEDMSKTKYVALAGDFNAKSPAWGSQVLDERGAAMMDLALVKGLVPINSTGGATFERCGRRSKIDCVLINNEAHGRLSFSRVLADYSASDHFYLLHEFRPTGEPSGKETSWKYSLRDVDQERVLSVYNEAREGLPWGNPDKSSLPKAYTVLVKTVCDTALRKAPATARGKTCYWWSAEIAELRKQTNKRRRKAQRATRRNSTDKNELVREFKVARKELRNAIRNSKEQKWREFCATLDNNPWGRPYLVVTRRLKGMKSTPIPEDMMGKIVENLFVVAPPAGTEEEIGCEQALDEQEIPPVSPGEILAAAKKIKIKKAAGVDKVPAAIVRILANKAPEDLSEVFTATLICGIPREWKKARLVCIRKPNKLGTSPGDYRPISILPAISKMWEYVIKGRIEEFLGTTGLHTRQYGFRKGKSTLDALYKVNEIVEDARRRNLLCAAVAFDIKNAFNTLPWKAVLEECRVRSVPPYLQKVLKNYLSERTIVVDKQMGEVEIPVYAGVPQGSVLGPLLWNVVYDGVLHTTGHSCTLIAFADDLLMVTIGRDFDKVRRNINAIHPQILGWFANKGLRVCPEKTSVIMLTRKWIPSPAEFVIDGREVTATAELKYLGVTIDTKRTFAPHVYKAVEKATRLMAALIPLLPNHGGPGQQCRRLYETVWNAVALYGAPIWGGPVLERGTLRLALRRAHKVPVLRVACCYRTTAYEAACVLGGTLPVHLRIKERIRWYKNLRQTRGEDPLRTRESRDKARKKLREDIVALWQAEWDNFNESNWTRRLIPDLREWLKGSGKVKMDYHLAQLLTGHGVFNQYRVRIGKTEDPACWDCGFAVDNAEHVLLACPRWSKERETLEEALGARVAIHDIVGRACKSTDSWTALRGFARTIMDNRIQKENEIQKQARLQEGTLPPHRRRR